MFYDMFYDLMILVELNVWYILMNYFIFYIAIWQTYIWLVNNYSTWVYVTHIRKFQMLFFLKVRFLGILILHQHPIGLSCVKTWQRVRTLSTLVCPSTGADRSENMAGLCVRWKKCGPFTKKNPAQTKHQLLWKRLLNELKCCHHCDW